MKENAEKVAIGYLEELIEIHRRDRDALPGSVVDHIRRALVILRKRKKAATPRMRFNQLSPPD